MRSITLFLLALLVPSALCAPDRKEAAPPPRREQAPPPIIDGPCNYGTIIQRGREIEIWGHAHWGAVGTIRADGKLQVMWTRLSDGALCPAVYRLNADGSITGWWAEGTTGADVDAEGELVGPVLYGETVRGAGR